MLESLNITGPLKPLCVIKIGPVSAYFFFLLTVSLICTSKVIPEQVLNDVFRSRKRKRDGTG